MVAFESLYSLSVHNQLESCGALMISNVRHATMLWMLVGNESCTLHPINRTRIPWQSNMFLNLIPSGSHHSFTCLTNCVHIFIWVSGTSLDKLRFCTAPNPGSHASWKLQPRCASNQHGQEILSLALCINRWWLAMGSVLCATINQRMGYRLHETWPFC